MKIAIDCIHYPISKSVHSHRASWAKYWKYLLSNGEDQVDILYRHQEKEWKNYDKVYIYHGMEFNGGLNLAGGLSDEIIDRFSELCSLDSSNFVSIDHKMPDYYELLKKRKCLIPDLKDWHLKADIVKFSDITSGRQIVLGDSHSLSAMLPVYDDKVEVYRTDFKTLHGAIGIGFENMADFSSCDYASFYFGSIDMRHHILRYGDVEDSINDITGRYKDQLDNIAKDVYNIEVIGLLPMPSDDRKLPKSGYFKETPFFGSISDRQNAVKLFNSKMKEICKERNWEFFEWPEEMTDSYGNLDQSFMEKPRSVHLSQISYRFDFEKMAARKHE